MRAVRFLAGAAGEPDGGKIVADDGSIKFAGGGVSNGGTIEARDYGLILFKSVGGFDGNPIQASGHLLPSPNTTGHPCGIALTDDERHHR